MAGISTWKFADGREVPAKGFPRVINDAQGCDVVTGCLLKCWLHSEARTTHAKHHVRRRLACELPTSPGIGTRSRWNHPQLDRSENAIFTWANRTACGCTCFVIHARHSWKGEICGHR